MGCSCDPGYSGADCSSRMCKYGIDPLYIDDESTARVSSATYIVRPGNTGLEGTYAIKFYDVFGDDFITEPIVASSTTTCLDVVSALEALPNTVIPTGSVFCSDFQGAYYEMLGSYDYENTDGRFMMYSLTFTGNPGYLKPIEIDSTLDGVRPTTNSSTAVWADGMTGEFTDYFATQCEHVYVDIAAVTSTVTPTLIQTGDDDVVAANSPTMLGNLNVYAKLDAMTATEKKLLKKCLGDADGDSTNNVEVYDWDYGAIKYFGEVGDSYLMSGTPHAIKLVKKAPADDYDGGKFALIWYNPKDDEFYVATKPSDTASEYAIFTTDGKAERVYSDGNLDSTYNHSETAAVAYFTQFTNTLYMSMDVSCETGAKTVEPCLEKGDLIFITDANWGDDLATVTDSPGNKEFFGGTATGDYDSGFAETAELYTITKIWKAEETATTATLEDKYRITVDKNINWDGSKVGDPDGNTVKDTGYVQIIKFTPATTRSASASRATPTTTAACRARSRCKRANHLSALWKEEEREQDERDEGREGARRGARCA